MIGPEREPKAVCPACGAETDASSPACFNCGHARQSALLKKGQVLSDRYELRSVLGRGGMGTVYEAHDRSLDERVALKVLSDAVRDSTDADRRFRDEIKLARKIRHPNVCGIHEYGKDQGIQYIVMEFIDGQDLKKYVRSRGKLTTQEAVDLARQIGEGLQAIHDAGVIHRDLKLANVMRDRTGRLRLMDFGIAKFMGDTTATATGHIIGTPEYMSPEQVQGFHVDPRSDLYSLGVMTYELLTGRVPFKANTPLATVMLQIHEPPRLDDPTIPPAIVPILRKALAKNPEERYESVRAFVAALTTMLSSPAQAASPPVRPPLATQYPATMEIVAAGPPPPKRTVERPVVAKPPARTPPVLASSERRFGLWLGALGGGLLGLAFAAWIFMQVGELLRGRPGPYKAEPAAESATNVIAPKPSLVPTMLPSNPSPLQTTASTPGATAGTGVESSPPGRTPPPSSPKPATPTSPRGTVADRASDRVTAEARPTPPAALQDPPGFKPASIQSRTPLPTAVLKALPNPTPAAQGVPAPLQTPFLTAAPTPESSVPPARAAGVGYLQLGAKPYARVIVDGKDAGTLPMRPLELAEGKHVVRFLHDDYQPLQRTVTIRRGETVKLFVDWSLDGIAK